MWYSPTVPSALSQRCSEIGIDGLILPDVPYEEKEEFRPICRQYGVDLISLIAPTSQDRIAMIAREAEGFLYVVSSLGVTGMRKEIHTDLASMIAEVRRNSDIPCAIGFGIADPRTGKNHGDAGRRRDCRICHCEASRTVRQGRAKIYRGICGLHAPGAG